MKTLLFKSPPAATSECTNPPTARPSHAARLLLLSQPPALGHAAGCSSPGPALPPAHAFEALPTRTFLSLYSNSPGLSGHSCYWLSAAASVAALRPPEPFPRAPECRPRLSPQRKLAPWGQAHLRLCNTPRGDARPERPSPLSERGKRGRGGPCPQRTPRTSPPKASHRQRPARSLRSPTGQAEPQEAHEDHEGFPRWKGGGCTAGTPDPSPPPPPSHLLLPKQNKPPKPVFKREALFPNFKGSLAATAHRG